MAARALAALTLQLALRFAASAPASPVHEGCAAGASVAACSTTASSPATESDETELMSVRLLQLPPREAPRTPGTPDASRERAHGAAETSANGTGLGGVNALKLTMSEGLARAAAVARRWWPSKAHDEGAEKKSTLEAADPRQKSMTVLLLIEMVPTFGALGFDRFYLGNDLWLACAKLTVCVCTLGFGGLIWSLVDFIVIARVALHQQATINALGMEATFNSDRTEFNFRWAIVAIVVWVFLHISYFASILRFLRNKASSARAPIEVR
eukprot:TRINITY_DN19528_c0_g2_i2.p1 TRINITY_DN19528_c0_g2~~TRINITY_DN19528_c0_g2_i2.p1  ORF type:complete len:269 (-),score=50.68 TRINITY_DN19528_c0_g2_i2:56-862(-)